MIPMVPTHTHRYYVILLAFVLIGVTAAQPLFVYGLPVGTDTIYHVQRVASLARSLEQGVVYPRWSPDLVYGFGYPIFNYYAPLFYYLAVVLTYLTCSPVQATTLLAALLYVVQALGLWKWLRMEFDDLAAFWGAVAYTLGSYTVSNLTGRGAVAEHLALSIIPLTAWTIGRFARSADAVWFVGATMSTAALLLSHNVSSLLLMGFLVVYAAYSGLAYRNARPLFALAVGALLTAFFWIPALAEREFVQMDLLHNVGWANYRHHFLSVRDHFGWPEPVDPLLAFQPRGAGLNVVVVTISLIGALLQGVWYARQRDRRAVLVLMAMAIFTTAFALTHRASEPAWDLLSPLRFLQFPWRFYSLVMISLSLLSAAAAQALVRLLPNRRTLLTVISACLVCVSAGYIYYGQIPLEVLPVDLDVTPLGIGRFEWATTYIGTTTAGEYLPIAVQERPLFDLSVYASTSDAVYSSATRRVEEWMDRSIRIEEETYTPYRYSLRVFTPSAADITFRTFYFPGWKAYVDGLESPISVTQPHGLISVPVSAGHHTILVVFESTPLRIFAWGVSGCSFLAVVLLAGRRYYFCDHCRVHERARTLDHPQRMSCKLSIHWMGVLMAAALAVTIKTLWVDRGPTPFAFTRFNGVDVKDAEYTLQKRFAEDFVLISADMPRELAATRADVPVTLYWRIIQEVYSEYSTSIHIVDPEGFSVGQSDHQYPGSHPVTEWKVGQYGRDQHLVRIQPGTPPGLYSVLVSAYLYGRPESLLSVTNDLGEPTGVTVEVGQIEVLARQWPDDLAALQAESPVVSTGKGSFELLGFSQPVKAATSGDSVPIFLFWKANGYVNEHRQVVLRFLDDRGSAVAELVLDPVSSYSTALWKPGEVWRGAHRIIVPPHLESGVYRLQLLDADSREINLESLTVQAPDRLFQEPEIGTSERTQFADAGELVQAATPALARAGEAVTVTLVWRATHETPQSYKVFVHLLDEEGRLIAGHDSEPANWTRPTTSWLPEEYVVDTHPILLPDYAPVRYRFRVGLYEPLTGERVFTAAGEDSVILSRFLDVR